MRTIQLTPDFDINLGDVEPDAFIPPEERLEWCNALLSGEHKQGNHFLYNIAENKKCCLGVKMLLEKMPYEAVDQPNYPISHYDVLVAVFNKHGASYIGSCPAIKPLGQFPFGTRAGLHQDVTLAGLNDRGVPFSIIALVINTIWCSETWRPYYVPPASVLL